MKQYQVAIRIYKNDIAFHYRTMRIDFLLDGELLHKDNVLFVIESMKISDDYIKELDKRGYHYVYAYPNALYKLFFIRQAWRKLLRHHYFKHYVVYNDMAPAHRIRNKVLKECGVQTWFYNHSGDYLHHYVPMDKIAETFEPLYMNLEYDHMLVRGKEQEDFYRRHKCRIGTYHRLGGIWNELSR